MITQIHPIPAFSDNYIWALLADDGSNACVVDPGDASPVIAYLEDNGLTLSNILVTHHHPDHVGGLGQLIEKYAPQIHGPGGSGIQGITNVVVEGDGLTLFGEEFTVLEVPGHTMDHIAYYCPHSEAGSPLLFCGDTLFAGGCGRLFEGTAPQMHHSLNKLKQLPDETKVYCAHEYTLANLGFAKLVEPENAAIKQRITEAKEQRNNHSPTVPSTLKLELDTNPFMRTDQASVILAAEAWAGRSLAGRRAVFRTVRAWKDRDYD